MAAEFNQIGQMLVISISGEIDHHESKSLREEIDSKIVEILPKKIVFDFSRTSFMDSSGLGLILGRYNKALTVGAELEIANPGEKIMRIISMSGVDKIISVKGVAK